MSMGGAILRAIVKLVDSSKLLQSLQVESLKDWPDDDVEHFEPYGYTAHPFGDAEGLMLEIGGDPDHQVVICVADRQYRLTGLAEGEVAIYDDQGQKVHLTRTGIVIETTGDVTVTAGGDALVEATGSATVKAGNNAKVEAGGAAQVDGASVVLGAALGALGVARIGDTVSVVPATGLGTITGSSSKVFAE